MTRTTACLLGIAAMLAGGCGLRPPIATYSGSRVVESTPQAVAIDVEFELSNDNNESIELRDFTYAVTANGRHVYEGRQAAERTLPRRSIVHASIPLVIRRDDLPQSGDVDWRLSGSLGYVAPGAFAETLLDIRIWQPTTAISAADTTIIPSSN